MNWLKNILTKLSQQGSINYLLKSNPSLFKEYQEKKKNIVIPSQYTGEAGEILKKWIFYRSKQGEEFDLNGLDVILVNPLDKAKSWFNNPNFSFYDLLRKNEEYHEKLKETQDRTYTPKYPITILKQYNNGLAWGRLETGYCSEYGDSLGHCGNAAGEYDDSQRIYTFYDTTTNIHYLTFIYHQDGILGEAKAYGNSKPPIDKIRIINREDLQSVNAQEVYKDLLLLKDKDQYIWNSIKGAGYKPENNFGFEDLNEKNKEEVKKERENIDDYFSYRKGKDNKELYFVEGNQIYFNKNITKEELKELILKDENLLRYKNIYNYISKFGLHYDNDILKITDEDSSFSYNILKLLNFDISKISKKGYERIYSNPSLAYRFAEDVNFDLNKIPKEIIKTISSVSGTSHDFSLHFYEKAKKMNFDLSKMTKNDFIGMSVNQELASLFVKNAIEEKTGFDVNNMSKEMIMAISVSNEYSYKFAEKLNFDFNKVPKEIMTSISKDAGYSYSVAENLKFKFNLIPEEIIESISKDSYYSRDISTYYFNILSESNFNINKIDKNMIMGISLDHRNAYSLTEIFLKNGVLPENIPKQIIDSVLKHSSTALKFAIKVYPKLTNVPHKIIQVISISPENSFNFAEKLNFQLNIIPKEIIDCIFKSPNYSYEFFKEINTQYTHINDEIIKNLITAISRSPVYSYDFARDLNFNLNKIPKEIIEGISEDPDYSYSTARGLHFNFEIIPKIIIEGILKYRMNRMSFLSELKHKDIEIPEWMKKYELA